MGGYRTVGDVMTPVVVAVTRDASFKEAAAAMHRWHVGALPVLDAGGRVTGVVSETDLLVTEEQRGTRSAARRNGADGAGTARAGDLMTSPAVTVPEDAPVPLAARTMSERGVHRLPVVGAEGRLVGMVTRSDLLKVFLRPDEDIAREVREDVVRPLFRSARPPAGVGDQPQIVVDVREGVVTLWGEIAETALVPVLARLARGVQGVVDVRCDMVAPGTRRRPGVPPGAAGVSDDRRGSGHDPRRHR